MTNPTPQPPAAPTGEAQEQPVIDQDRLIRILSYGNFGGIQSVDKYYVIYDFGDFKIQLRIEELAIDFWIQEEKCAYVPVSLAIPAQHNAYFSNSIRWVFGRLLKELKETGTIDT